MAKYSVDHTCGHSQTHELLGPHKERDRKLAWLETTVCSDCCHAKREADHAAAATLAAEENQAAGLPALIGSEKQVAWAESIRVPICAALAAAESTLAARTWTSPEAEREMRDAFALIVDEVCGRTDARWWIDEGRHLGFTSPESAAGWVGRQAKGRGLVPTAVREHEEHKARVLAEREASRTRHEILVAEIMQSWSDAGLTWDPETDAVSGTVAGHEVRLATVGFLEVVTVDGATIDDPGVLRQYLSSFGSKAKSSLRLVERLRRSDSLAGASVASVQKDKQVIKVTLGDGRVLTGRSSREGWSLAGVVEGHLEKTLDPTHPEVKRLAAEARAWAKKAGVK